MTGKIIGLLPRSYASEWVARGQLREIKAGDLAVQQKCYAVVRSEVAASKVCGRMLLDLKRAFATLDRGNAEALSNGQPRRLHERDSPTRAIAPSSANLRREASA